MTRWPLLNRPWSYFCVCHVLLKNPTSRQWGSHFACREKRCKAKKLFEKAYTVEHSFQWLHTQDTQIHFHICCRDHMQLQRRLKPDVCIICVEKTTPKSDIISGSLTLTRHNVLNICYKFPHCQKLTYFKINILLNNYGTPRWTEELIKDTP